MSPVRHTDLRLYRRIARWARPYWLHIAGLFFLSVLATPLALLTPLPLKIAVDSGLGTTPLPRLVRPFLPGAYHLSQSSALIVAVCLLLAITLLSQSQALAVSILRTFISERLLLDFRSQIFAHAQRLSLSYHDTRGTMDSIYRIQNDATSIQAIAVEHMIALVTSSLTLLGMLYVTARIDRRMALVALVISPLLFLIARTYRPGLRRGSHAVKALEHSAFAVLQEVLGALRVVKSFGREEDETGRFVRRSVQGISARLRLALAEGKFNLLVALTTSAGTATVLFVGLRRVQSNAITLGELLLVMSYLAQLYEPLKTLSKKSAALQSHLAGAERSFALLDRVPEVAETRNPRPLARAAGAVSFHGVSFAYAPDRPALREVSFRIEPQSVVGVVGATGAGKTTLVSLLMRFYDPTGGRILLDGMDIREFALSDLRRQFALVQQEPVLFSTSIAENIAYARPDAGEEEIRAAAQAANAHRFIRDLPEGYQTLVGERGMNLSGGERQRISLARAFLKDAPILVLDEATSAVDTGTEAAILEALESLMRGRTTMIITHRMSALKYCDEVLTIDHGWVAGMGSAATRPVGENSAVDAVESTACGSKPSV